MFKNQITLEELSYEEIPQDILPRLADLLEEKERVILYLIVKWELSHSEVAEIFGHTPEWVCRRYKKIIETARNHFHDTI